MADTIRLKRGTTEPTAGVLVTGELAVNTGDGNIYTKLDDGTVSLIGSRASRLEIPIRNETGSTIPAGSAVYITGAQGNKPLVSLAQANSEMTSSKTLGLTTTAISNNNNGYAILFGSLDKIDTLAYTAGQALWLSPTVAGGLTTTVPTAPNHSVFIGIVITSANNGKIEVRVANGYELAELHNVSISSLADKDIISYNSATGLYENQTATELGLAPLASPTFTGNVTAGGNLVSNFSSGDEGGEIKLATAQTNSVLSGGSVTIDINQSQLRIFETGGSNRGAYINLASASNGVGSNLLMTAATSAEARLLTNNSKFLTPNTAHWMLMNPNIIQIQRAGFQVTNTGTITYANGGWISSWTRTGTAGACSSRWRTFGVSQVDQTVSMTDKANVASFIDFSNTIWCSGRSALSGITDAVMSWGFYHGKAEGDGVGQLTRRGFGWRALGGAGTRYLSLEVHNGTSLTSVASSHALVDGVAFDWDLISNGSGTVTLYINGSQVATSTAGPTGLVNLTPVIWQEEIATSAAASSPYNGMIHSRGKFIAFD